MDEIKPNNFHSYAEIMLLMKLNSFLTVTVSNFN